MKKYFFEAQKKQLEKPTEPLYVSCTSAKCWVVAETEAEAVELAGKKFRDMYHGTGVVLGKPVLTKATEPAIDWNYGYGDDRKCGDTAAKAELRANNVIR